MLEGTAGIRVYNPDFVGVPDEALVSRAQAGDNAAFGELVERHQTTCKRMALSILRDEANAEDEVQNGLWKAYVHLGQFQREEEFSTWLTRIVVNQCLMRLRRDRRAGLLHLDEGVEGVEVAMLELPDLTESPEGTSAHVEIGAILKAEIRRIPPMLRDVFLLRDVEELPMPDVASRLGISIAAAKSRLLRARLALRDRMEKYCGRMGAATLTV